METSKENLYNEVGAFRVKQGIQFHYLAPFSEKARKNKVYVCMYVFLD